MAIILSPEHGYVILAASGTYLVNFWQGANVSIMRKRLGIEVRYCFTYVEYLSLTLFSTTTSYTLHNNLNFSDSILK